MILRLDARFPVVWRSPNSLQFGVDAPALVLEEVSLPTEHMVAAIAAGVTRSGLLMVGKAAGATEQEVAEFIRVVTPALQAETSTTPHPIVIVGGGLTAERTGRLLASAGFDVRIATSLEAAEAEQCDFAVAVSSYVVEPALHGVWLRRDTPHLAIVLGDTAVDVGPVIEPGRGPCLYCLQRHATDVDPAWPAIATQLWGKHSAADSELIASEVAALTTRLVVAHFASGGESVGTRTRIDVATGGLTETSFAPHPDCGCIEAGMTNALAGSTPSKSD